MIREIRLERCSSIRKYKAFDALLNHFVITFICIDCGDSSKIFEQRCKITRSCDFSQASLVAQR